MVRRTLLTLGTVVVLYLLVVTFWNGGLGHVDLQRIVVMEANGFDPGQATELKRLDSRSDLRVFKQAAGRGKRQLGITDRADPDYIVRAEYLLRPNRFYLIWTSNVHRVQIMRSNTKRLHTVSGEKADRLRTLLTSP